MKYYVCYTGVGGLGTPQPIHTSSFNSKEVAEEVAKDQAMKHPLMHFAVLSGHPNGAGRKIFQACLSIEKFSFPTP